MEIVSSGVVLPSLENTEEAKELRERPSRNISLGACREIKRSEVLQIPQIRMISRVLYIEISRTGVVSRIAQVSELS